MDTVVIIDQTTFVPSGRPGVFAINIKGWCVHRGRKIQDIVPQAGAFGVPSGRSFHRTDINEALPEFEEGVRGFQVRIPPLNISGLSSLQLHLSIIYSNLQRETVALEVELSPPLEASIIKEIDPSKTVARNVLKYDEFEHSAERIFLPQLSHPLISVILISATFDGAVYQTLRSIEALRQHSIEVVIATGVQSNVHENITHRVEGATFVDGAPGENRVRGMNACAHRAKGKFLLFARPGIELSSDCIEAMVSQLQTSPHIGAVSVPILDTLGLTVSGAFRLGVNAELSLADPKMVPHVIQLSDGIVLSDDCLLIPREVFEAAGGFSVEFTCGNHHDVDLSLRLLEGGFTLGYANVPVRGVSSLPHRYEGERGSQSLLASMHQVTIHRQAQHAGSQMQTNVSINLIEESEGS